jgi:diguanylate cyclase (GGDEF)-like protein
MLRCACAIVLALSSGLADTVVASTSVSATPPADSEQGLPLIRTFSPAAFDTPATPVGSQVFAIAPAKDGALLAANNEGLLRLDGTGWRTWDPIRGAILSVTTRGDGRVFVGGVDDLGYFDRFGSNFVSLRDWSGKIGKPFGEFWIVLAGDKLTHFVDRERAYRWDGQRMTLVYQASGETRSGALLAGAAVILDPGVGLVQLETMPTRTIPGSKVLIGAHDCALGAAGADIVTVCDDGVLRLWSATGSVRALKLDDNLARQLADAKPSALATLDHGYAIATRQGGLFLLDADGRLQGQLSQLSGLDNVRTFSLLATGADGLWMGRDHGLAMVEWPGQVSRYDIDIGLPRVPLGVGRLEGRLYAVTSAGVYTLQPGSNGFARAAPQALIGNVLFDVTQSSDSLFIPARDGLYALTAGGVQKIDPRLCYEVLFIDGSPQRLVVGGDNGAWVMEKKSDGGWHAVGDVPGISTEIRRIVADGPTSLWLSSRAARQLFRVRWSDDATASWTPGAAHVEDYSSAAGVSPGPVTPLMLPDGMLFATANGLFRFDPARHRFAPDQALDALLPRDNGEVRAALALDPQHAIVVQHDRFRMLVRDERGWSEKISPLGRIPRGAVPRSLYRDSDGSLWLTTSDAIYRHQPALQSTLPSLPAPRVELERGHGSEAVSGSENKPLQLGVAPMQLAFRFSSAEFVGAEHVRFRSRLLPIESEWSPWSDRSVRELSYVRGGDFVLEVQARDIFDRISRTTRVRLHLDRPWYLTAAAFALYALALLAVIVLIVRRHDRQLRARAHALELLVRERTQALEKASVTDQLTGLHNRHYFDIATRDLLAQGGRTLVALIDLDHFKRINDSCGHEVGDKVLMEVASRLIAAAPAHAVLFRWGGEEFLLLAPLLDGSDGTAQVVGRILHRVGDSVIALAPEPALAMTCSIGWEIAPQGDSPSIHEALRTADLNLYAAKQNGRDRAHGPGGAIELRESF